MKQNLSQINGGIMINNDKYWCWCKCKKHYICEKDYVWYPATCNCENGKNIASIMDDSMITCDEMICKAKSEGRWWKNKFIWKEFLNFTCFFKYYYSVFDSC